MLAIDMFLTPRLGLFSVDYISGSWAMILCLGKESHPEPLGRRLIIYLGQEIKKKHTQV